MKETYQTKSCRISIQEAEYALEIERARIAIGDGSQETLEYLQESLEECRQNLKDNLAANVSCSIYQEVWNERWCKTTHFKVLTINLVEDFTRDAEGEYYLDRDLIEVCDGEMLIALNGFMTPLVFPTPTNNGDINAIATVIANQLSSPIGEKYTVTGGTV